jgi:uncharacterized protein (UPF0147 family)
MKKHINRIKRKPKNFVKISRKQVEAATKEYLESGGSIEIISNEENDQNNPVYPRIRKTIYEISNSDDSYN